MKKILVPFDFSEVAKNAFDHAIGIADLLSSEVVLVNLVQAKIPADIPAQPISFLEREFQKKEVEARGKIDSFLAGYKDGSWLDNPNLIVYVQKGLVSENLPELVESLEIDLVVMGTTGATGFKELVSGSLTYQIAERVRVPVLAVPQNTLFNGINKVVFATSLLPEDDQVFTQMEDLFGRLGSKMTCLHINSHKESFEEESRKMKGLEESHWFSPSKVDFRIISAKNIEKGLGDFMRSEEGDILILVTKDRGFWDNLLHHSISRGLANHAPFPVMILHPVPA